MTDMALMLGSLTARFDAQDKVLQEVRADLKEVRVQTTRTNGRVTALEQDKAVRDDRTNQNEKQHTQRSRRVQWMLGVACTLFGGFGTTLVLSLTHIV